MTKRDEDIHAAIRRTYVTTAICYFAEVGGIVTLAGSVTDANSFWSRFSYGSLLYLGGRMGNHLLSTLRTELRSGLSDLEKDTNEPSRVAEVPMEPK